MSLGWSVSSTLISAAREGSIEQESLPDAAQAGQASSVSVQFSGKSALLVSIFSPSHSGWKGSVCILQAIVCCGSCTETRHSRQHQPEHLLQHRCKQTRPSGRMQSHSLCPLFLGLAAAQTLSSQTDHFVAVHLTPCSTGQPVCMDASSWLLSGLRV